MLNTPKCNMLWKQEEVNGMLTIANGILYYHIGHHMSVLTCAHARVHNEGIQVLKQK